MATKPATTSNDIKTAQPTALRAVPGAKKSPRTLNGTHQADDAARKSTLALYESALKLLQSGKYDKAHEAFTRMLETAPPDLAASIRRNLAICADQIDKSANSFLTQEERYDYAISLLNTGHYEDAREHLEAIRLTQKSADYAFYGLALLASMTGDGEKCLEHLTEAIRLNPQNRLQARNDSDFDPVADDPRFTELLYPEA
jgi:tetratricopeptide (TPR) repeat protein